MERQWQDVTSETCQRSCNYIRMVLDSSQHLLLLLHLSSLTQSFSKWNIFKKKKNLPLLFFAKLLSTEKLSQTSSKHSIGAAVFPIVDSWWTVYHSETVNGLVSHLRLSFLNLFISHVLSCYFNVEHSLSSPSTMSAAHLSPYSNLYWVLAWGLNPFPGSLTGKATRNQLINNTLFTECRWLCSGIPLAQHTGMSVNHLSMFKYLSCHLSNCSRHRFHIAIVSKSLGLGPDERCQQRARVLCPFVSTFRYYFSCTHRKQHLIYSPSHSIFCSAGLQDHRYITMRSFRPITSSCHTKPEFPHLLFKAHNTSI